MNFVEYVVISLNKLESRGRTSIKKIINLYIIAAQNNKDCVCFLYKQEPENIKSQLPVFQNVKCLFIVVMHLATPKCMCLSLMNMV